MQESLYGKDGAEDFKTSSAMQVTDQKSNTAENKKNKTTKLPNLQSLLTNICKHKMVSIVTLKSTQFKICIYLQKNRQNQCPSLSMAKQ